MFRRLVYSLVTSILWVLFVFAGRVRFLYLWRPPRQGAFLFASNHISHFDPPILSAFFPRKIDWIAMEELFSKSWSSAFFTSLDVIPVDRNGEDRNALRIAIKRLKDGHVIGIFPEGGIRDGSQSMVAGAPPRPGLAMMCMHSGVPLVPVVILGSDRFYNAKSWLPWRRPKVWVAIGEPLLPVKDLPREDIRAKLLHDYSSACVRLKDTLCEKFSLTAADLPHSPQQRMAEP